MRSPPWAGCPMRHPPHHVRDIRLDPNQYRARGESVGPRGPCCPSSKTSSRCSIWFHEASFRVHRPAGAPVAELKAAHSCGSRNEPELFRHEPRSSSTNGRRPTLEESSLSLEFLESPFGHVNEVVDRDSVDIVCPPFNWHMKVHMHWLSARDQTQAPVFIDRFARGPFELCGQSVPVQRQVR